MESDILKGVNEVKKVQSTLPPISSTTITSLIIISIIVLLLVIIFLIINKIKSNARSEIDQKEEEFNQIISRQNHAIVEQNQIIDKLDNQLKSKHLHHKPKLQERIPDEEDDIDTDEDAKQFAMKELGTIQRNAIKDELDEIIDK
jgi:flagellar biosynthesis/type III secretory pathway M-ring protein FliF/YscJ